jgi:hypothetical protein
MFVSLLQGRLLLLTGAGTSASEPTDLPVGASLARLLVDWLQRSGMGSVVDGVDQSDLGEVCAAIEAHVNRPALLTQILTLVPWKRRPFNLCHYAMGLLIAEGLLERSFTVNWDPKVAEASRAIAELSLDCPCDVPTLTTSTPPRFIHLHGDVDHPDTLIATTADLTKPSALQWSQPILQGALNESDIAIIGFAAEPEYILRSLEDMPTALAGKRPKAVVSDRPLGEFVASSPRLARATGLDVSSDHYVQGQACEVLGELLRGVYRKMLTEVFDQAIGQARTVERSHFRLLSAALDETRSALFAQPLVWLLGFIHQAGDIPASDDVDQPIVGTRRESLANVFAMVLILKSAHDAGAITFHAEVIELELAGGDPIQFWPVLPLNQSHLGAVYRNAVAKSSAYTRPRDATLPVSLLCSNVYGMAPGHGHASLVTPASPSSLTRATRPPADVLTLADLESRIAALNTPPALADMVRIP